MDIGPTKTLVKFGDPSHAHGQATPIFIPNVKSMGKIYLGPGLLMIE